MKWIVCLLLFTGLAAHAATVTEVRYLDQDPGGEPYLTRILVTRQFMRLDDGQDGDDFVLFDRKKRQVVNVMHGLKTLLWVSGKPLPPTRPVIYKVDEKADKVRKDTTRVQLRANGELCSETVSVSGMLPDVVSAMAEYKSALAYTQLQTFLNTPENIRQPCDLVHHVWESGRSLAHGLPLEERDYAGRVRKLSGTAKRPFDPSWFALPGGYATIQPPEAGQTSSSVQPSSVQSK